MKNEGKCCTREIFAHRVRVNIVTVNNNVLLRNREWEYVFSPTLKTNLVTTALSNNMQAFLLTDGRHAQFWGMPEGIFSKFAA